MVENRPIPNRDPQAALPGPDDITRVELPNGVVMLARPNFSSSSVVITGYLQAGGLYDPDEKLGLASFTAATLMRGTAHHDHRQIYGLLESSGASLGFLANTHTCGFSSRALSEDVDLLLELIAESLQGPVFPPGQIERFRTQLLTGLALRAQSTDAMASLTFDKLVYRSHPYSRPEEGFPDTVQAIAREDLIEFHQRHYGPQGTVIAIVGGIEAARAVDKVTHFFEGWENPRQLRIAALPGILPLEGIAREHVPIPGKSQTSILMGVAGPPRRTPDFLAASLGNSVLGRFGMYGRIGEVVREQAGLAYYAYSSLSGSVGPGPWSVAAGVDPNNVDKAIALICHEIRRFVDQGVTAEELSDSQANYTGRLPLSLETNAGVAGSLLTLERHQLGLDYYRTYADRIHAITPAEVLNASRRYLDPERLAIATAGT